MEGFKALHFFASEYVLMFAPQPVSDGKRGLLEYNLNQDLKSVATNINTMDTNSGIEQKGKPIFPPPETMWPPPKTDIPKGETPKKAELAPLHKLNPQNTSKASEMYKVLTSNSVSYKKGCQIDMKTDPLHPSLATKNEMGVIPTKAFINIDYGSIPDVAVCELVTGDRRIRFTINAQGEIRGDVSEEPDIDLLLTNLFVITGKGVGYADFVSNGTRNLELFADYNPITGKREGTPVEKPTQNSTGPETIAAELESIDSKNVRRIRTKISVETFKLEGGEQAKPIEGVDREKIARNALFALLEDTKDKISPERHKELEKLASSGQILFLHKDEYFAFVGEDQTENELSAATAFGLTIDNNLILINQDAITSFPNVTPSQKPKALETYKLMRTNNGSQEHYKVNTREQMQAALVDQIEYVFGIAKTSRESLSIQPSDEVIKTELIGNLLWSIVYHEGLHFATDNNHFLSGLDEAATHYKTAQATNNRLGKNAFCGYVMASGLNYAINWTAFLRTFPITEDVANEMYYNPQDTWIIKKIFDTYPKEKHAELLNWLQYGTGLDS